MKQVYVMLSRTQTVTSKLVHTFTHGTYTHTSLALVPKTDEFYSYARRRLYNFLIGGIFKENTKSFVFARFPDSPCVLYEINVSDESYEKIKAFVDELMADYDHSTYSFLGTLVMRLGIVWKRKQKFTCSQFVAVALSQAEELKFPKDPYIMLPHDFLKMEGLEKIYEGTVDGCNFAGATVNLQTQTENNGVSKQ